MTLEIPGAKITVESTHNRFEFQTASARISSVNGGKTHHLTVDELYGMRKSPNSKLEPINVSIDLSKTDEPALNPVKQAALKHVKLMARKIERTKLANARRVEEAHETGQANLSFAAHDFNEAVLSATHEGIPYEDIQAHLHAEGITGLSHDVACASGRDWDLLYPSVVE